MSERGGWDLAIRSQVADGEIVPQISTRMFSEYNTVTKILAVGAVACLSGLFASRVLESQNVGREWRMLVSTTVALCGGVSVGGLWKKQKKGPALPSLSTSPVFDSLDGKKVLVFGLGGGADGQGACALALSLRDRFPDIQVAYGTTFDVTTNPRQSDGEPYAGARPLVDSPASTELLRVTPRQFTRDELAAVHEDTKIPVWVNTLMYEQTLEQTEHQTRNGSVIKSPIIACLDKRSKSKRERLVEELEGVHDWDLIIGLDHGGDVFEGVEDGADGTDLYMVNVFADLAHRISKTRPDSPCRFTIVVHGLCIDGENYYDMMTEKMVNPTKSILSAAEGVNSLRGEFSKRLRNMCTYMSDTKTPKIILAGIDDELAKSDTYNGLDDMSNVDSLYSREQISDLDCFGLPIHSFSKSRQRHHRDKEGRLLPPPIVPSHWVTSGFAFDGMKIAGMLRTD